MVKQNIHRNKILSVRGEFPFHFFWFFSHFFSSLLFFRLQASIKGLLDAVGWEPSTTSTSTWTVSVPT